MFALIKIANIPDGIEHDEPSETDSSSETGVIPDEYVFIVQHVLPGFEVLVKPKIWLVKETEG